jgi:phosphatidylglycerol:prolipoprotein diacylglycerol transferase
MIGWFFWDPKSEFFILPFINIPLTWYGVFFAFGFWVSFQIFNTLIARKFKEQGVKDFSRVAEEFSERFLIYAIVATILGARLGHIFFYENPMPYLKNPFLILKTWEGGLASHGGVAFVIFSVYLFYKVIEKERTLNKSKYGEISFLSLWDISSISALFLAIMIRFGNFMNQEILGKKTELPWGIIFGHPRDFSEIVPRHPAQLYEAFFYFLLFLVSLYLWNKKNSEIRNGKFFGFIIFSVFTFRFFVEFIKSEQSTWFDLPASTFLMGHMLSLPFIFLGLYLMLNDKWMVKNFRVKR